MCFFAVDESSRAMSKNRLLDEKILACRPVDLGVEAKNIVYLIHWDNVHPCIPRVEGHAGQVHVMLWLFDLGKPGCGRNSD